MYPLFSEAQSVAAVNERMGSDTAPRLRQIMTSLVTHLHGFIKDVELTEKEWEDAVGFLTETGQMCSEHRQEFILLSDTLGVSMLVDSINHRRPSGATENTVFGPFHLDNAPHLDMGATISLDGKGESCLYEGRVLTLDGQPIGNATIDVWSDNADGFYDVQQPGDQLPMNNRGIFRTGPDGRYVFTGIKPVSYPIPYDGPVGRMLQKMGRHPHRPAHVHFLVSAENFDRVITHIFVAGDDYLGSDAVFGVKETLVVDFKPNAPGETMWKAHFDFVLHSN